MASPLRIANCSGFYGDRLAAASEMVGGGPIDVLTGDWLAELTMLILAKNRLRDPQSGYVRRNISPANFPSPIQIVEIVLPAGARVAYETGARDVSIHQQIWVQEGTVEVTLGRVTHRLAEDDCLAMRLNEPTAFRNRTRKPARYLVIIASERSRAPRR